MSRRRKLIWGVIIVLIVLPIIVPTFTLNRAKQRILQSLQAGLGRRVSADSVHLVLFPLPGFELDHVRLAEDPAFGQEDMATAWDARATLRLWSLLGGKIEFSSVHLDEPNINLVRNRAGQWNFSTLLDRARQGIPPLRPTGAASSWDSSVRFPYLEWNDGRINFKFNDDKTRLYLGNVKGSLALDGDHWRVHLQFEPLRNDLNLSDTGEVIIDGHWQAGRIPFRQLPFDLSVHLDQSYLAASTALFAGHDAGVHGIVSAGMRVQGTGDSFQLSGSLHADAVRRWDLLPPPTSLDASFLAHYQTATDTLVIDGLGDRDMTHLRIVGQVHQLLTEPHPDLTLYLHDFPMENMLVLARAVKRSLPHDLHVAGMVNGTASWHDTGDAKTNGSGSLTATQVALAAGNDLVQIPALTAKWDGQRLEFTSAAITVKNGSAHSEMALSAQTDAHDFQVHLTSADLTAATSSALSRLWAMRNPWFDSLEGTAALDLTVAAPWEQFRTPAWRGSETLKTALFHPGSSTGIPLHGVVVHFASPEPTRVQFVATVGKNPVSGWVQFPSAPSAEEGPLPKPEFALKADHLQSSALWALLVPTTHAGFIDRVLQQVHPNFLSRIHANGEIDVADLEWNGYHSAVHARVQAGGTKWSAPTLEIKLGGGLFDGSAEFSQGVYSITGHARNIRIAPVLAHSRYSGHVDGVLTGTLQLVHHAGSSLPNAVANGSLTIRQGWIAGNREHHALRQSFTTLAADYQLHQGVVQLEDLLLKMPSQTRRGSGSIRLDQGYALTLDQGSSPWRLQGIFAAAPPRRAVTGASSAQASLQ